jgi:hypothetical protein
MSQYLSFELSERILNVQDGLEHWTLEHRDKSIEVGPDLAIVPQVLGLAHLGLHLFQEIEGGASLTRYWHSHWELQPTTKTVSQGLNQV